MPEFPTLAAVDLGSNSFHLQVARVEGDQLYPLDSLRDAVRLGAGLTSDKRLDEATQARALDSLARFGERLRGLPKGAVRAVGTNALRVAKNSGNFLRRAQQALGVPIEVIAGREEARLTFLGVVHELPPSDERRLVVDIGGGSTEFVIGRRLKPERLESLYMGCVSWSLRYFPGGKVTKATLKQAEIAAQAELETIVTAYGRRFWDSAFASSGTARALAELTLAHGLGDGTLTLQGLEGLRVLALRNGGFERLAPEGFKADRLPVLPGGLAIMTAVLAALGVERMDLATGALRQGILYDLLGRVHHHDMRDVTVGQFMQRYHVDPRQARRVADLARKLHAGIARKAEEDDDPGRLLVWAAKLHEIGLSVAHNGYHKHSAYILRNADMPGFSRPEQARLANVVLGHRGTLRKMQGLIEPGANADQLIALRLATLFLRGRTDLAPPGLALSTRRRGDGYRIDLDPQWLAGNPLTEASLREEIREWAALDIDLEVEALGKGGEAIAA
jgi:exopolyphosphatase/guanosine-5'-triphosphate,3'-diphosphate pyrophosphatase